MIRKIFITLICCLCIICSSCTFSKEDIQKEAISLEKKNINLKEEYDKYKNVDILFNFYYNLTLDTLHSLVLVESKNLFTSYTTYSEGVVVYNNGYNYYILTDYNKLLPSNNVRYRVMDARANVYEASFVYHENNLLYDTQTGLVLLRIQVVSNNSDINEISLGEKTDTMAIISNVDQLNKIQIIDSNCVNGDEIVNYDNQSYKVSIIDDFNCGSLINIKGELTGFYLYNLQGFADYSLIKKVAYATYSLIL